AAEVSGVMFTPQQPGESTRIEASWGLGLPIVGGTVTPDSYEVTVEGSITSTVGSKRIRTDVDVIRDGVMTRAVTAERQHVRTLDDGTVAALVTLGDRIADLQGSPQDIEWALADGSVWVLQARPVTAPLPPARVLASSVPTRPLTGAPGS